jgi:hypothetical protein
MKRKLCNLKRIFLTRIFYLWLVSFNTVILSAQNPAYLLELRNDIQVSGAVYEFDVYLLRTGTISFEYAQGQYGIVVNSLIKNGGSLTATIVAGSSDPILVASNQNPASIAYNNTSDAIMIAPKSPPTAGNGAIISNVSPGTRICRVRLTNTADFDKYRPYLSWTTTTIYPTQVYAYVGGANTKITAESNHTTSNLVNPILNEITSIQDNINDDFDLQVYPNPFNNKLFVSYNLLNRSHVTLSVFDINGRLVDELVNEEQQSGEYTKTWDSVSRSEGVYILKFQVDMTQKNLRIVLSH